VGAGAVGFHDEHEVGPDEVGRVVAAVVVDEGRREFRVVDELEEALLELGAGDLGRRVSEGRDRLSQSL